MKREGDNKVKYGTVSLPLPLIEKIKKKIKGTGMSSVSAYVTFVFRQLLAEGSLKENKNVFSKKEEKMMRERLKSLGYI